jgi:hypothetical protein
MQSGVISGSIVISLNITNKSMCNGEVLFKVWNEFLGIK